MRGLLPNCLGANLMMVWTIKAERPMSPRARLSGGNPPFMILVESFTLVIKTALFRSLAAITYPTAAHTGLPIHKSS